MIMQTYVDTVGQYRLKSQAYDRRVGGRMPIDTGYLRSSVRIFKESQQQSLARGPLPQTIRNVPLGENMDVMWMADYAWNQHEGGPLAAKSWEWAVRQFPRLDKHLEIAIQRIKSAGNFT